MPHDLGVTWSRHGAALGAGLGAGALGLGLGLGWFYSGVLLHPRSAPAYPELVLSSTDVAVTLRRSRLAAQPGTWGLRWAGGLARIGCIQGSTAGAVVREVLGGQVPPTGTRAVIDAGPFDPDPGARGLRFTHETVITPLGPAPAWLVPAPGPDWVVLVHGRGGARRESLRILPALHRAGHPTLTITYRNDLDAPASPDGRYHLGDTEWEDLQAAVGFVRSCGARRIALYGWSMGAAIIGAYLDRSPDAADVAAVVWDSPLVDWRATLRQQARNRRLPARLGGAAALVTRRRIGIDFARFDLLANPPAVRPPTLVMHSAADTVVPAAPSRALAAAAPGIDWSMRYLEVDDVEHTGAWNADPRRYERAVTGFLAEHLARWGM